MNETFLERSIDVFFREIHAIIIILGDYYKKKKFNGYRIIDFIYERRKVMYTLFIKVSMQEFIEC